MGALPLDLWVSLLWRLDRFSSVHVLIRFVRCYGSWSMLMRRGNKDDEAFLRVCLRAHLLRTGLCIVHTIVRAHVGCLVPLFFTVVW